MPAIVMRYGNWLFAEEDWGAVFRYALQELVSCRSHIGAVKKWHLKSNSPLLIVMRCLTCKTL